MEIKKHLKVERPNYARHIDLNGPIWQHKYYSFNIHSEMKLREKLSYMHENPVTAGLVEEAVDWAFSSARWYLLAESVGVSVGFDS